MAGGPGTVRSGEGDFGISAGPLEQARAAVENRRWSDAYDLLTRADGERALSADDLELLAVAALLVGESESSRHARLRAYHIHINARRPAEAARFAVQIGLDQIETAELAEATGCLPNSLTSCPAWTAQASALLKGDADSGGQGWLLIPPAYQQLAIDDDPTQAAALWPGKRSRQAAVMKTRTFRG